MPSIHLPDLPLTDLYDDFHRTLGQGSLLLEAEPGAGKSTLAPLWVLQTVAGEVWLVQPRVLAAINVAKRLAGLCNEAVGETVGHQVPFNRRAGKNTRLVVMTPGILLQRLLADPELTGVGCVMLDEIHERSVDQDVAWAWLQEATILNESLALVLMSATPDAALREQVDHALYSPGRCFEVSLDYCPPHETRGRSERLEDHVLRSLQTLTDWQRQTVLVFLPGWRDITRCQNALADHFPGQPAYRLHSRVPDKEQAQALNASLGPRVILATNIAETSLTISDVTLVIDSGLVREAEFIQKTGVTHLQTRRISQASAEQRRGRAGRVQAGRCIRLWAKSEVLVPQALPEIRRSDYLPLALRLAHWGTPAADLPWLEAPNPQGLANAAKTLRRWDFINVENVVTQRGRIVAKLGTHPRIAALILQGVDAPAWWLMTLALHFDLPLNDSFSDWLAHAQQQYKYDRRWQAMAKRWARVLDKDIRPAAGPIRLNAEQSLALAKRFTARLGKQTDTGQYQLNSGISVALNLDTPWAWVAQLARRGRGHVGTGLAVALQDAQLQNLAVAQYDVEYIGHGHRGRWVQKTQFMLGGQCVSEAQEDVANQDLPRAVLDFIKHKGLAHIDWPEAALNLVLRARWAQRLSLVTLPALDFETLTRSLDQWLMPFLNTAAKPNALPLNEAFEFYLGFSALQNLNRLVPKMITIPSGQQVRIDYQDDAAAAALIRGDKLPIPSIAAKLQAFFGAESLGVHNLPLQIKLLSPAQRPLAITQDLGYFWREVYPQVRRENRGRYVKHPWPDNPLAHEPTAKTNRALRRG